MIAMPRRRQLWTRPVVVAAFLLLAGVALTNWLRERTVRLTVQEDVSKTESGDVRQRYAIQSHQVVPQITMIDGASVTFVIPPQAPREFRFGANPRVSSNTESQSS